jgi:hypothetical protein
MIKTQIHLHQFVDCNQKDPIETTFVNVKIEDESEPVMVESLVDPAFLMIDELEMDAEKVNIETKTSRLALGVKDIS